MKPVLKIKDKNGEWVEVPAIKGSPGTTPHIGENGNWWIGEADTGVKAEGSDYVITEADKAKIANLVLAALPNGDEVSY